MSEEAIQAIAQTAKIAAPVGQGFADRSAATYNADILRTQGRYAIDAAASDEAIARREGRSIIAQQAANAIAEGGAGSSAMDVIRQNEVSTIADALAIRAKGQMEAVGYESKARAVESEGDQALYSGLTSAGAELLRTPYERRARRLQVGNG